jgi:hypothetical protein
MEESVDHAVKILADGTALVTLTVSRTHTGTKGAPFSGVRNVDYLRVYVPSGSTLVEADGFSAMDPKLMQLPDADYRPDEAIAAQEAATRTDRDSGTEIWEEHGKTVFGNWVMTDPGQTSVVTLVYRLPSSAVEVGADGTLSYGLTVQKRSGANPAAFTSHLDIPRGYDAVWRSQERAEDDRGRLSVTETLRTDHFTGALIAPR